MGFAYILAKVVHASKAILEEAMKWTRLGVMEPANALKSKLISNLAVLIWFWNFNLISFDKFDCGFSVSGNRYKRRKFGVNTWLLEYWEDLQYYFSRSCLP